MTTTNEELIELVAYLSEHGVKASANGHVIGIDTPKGYFQFKELWFNPPVEPFKPTEEEEEARQAYENYGGANHGNYDQ